MKIINKLKNKFLKELMIIALLIIITISSTGQVFAQEIIITNSIEIADEIDQGGLGGAISESESTGIPQNEEDKKSNIGLSSSTSVTAGLEASSTDVRSMVSITENGYEVNANYALRILRALEENAVDTYAFEFRDEDYDVYATDDESQTYKSDEELTNIVDKYIRTELRNMLPDIGEYAKTAINGNVIIKRYTAKYGRYNAQDDYEVAVEGGTDFEDGITLKYIPYEELLEMSKETVYSKEQIDEYLGYFSINPNGMRLCVLVSEEEYTWAYNNPPPERAIDDSGTSDPAGVELLPSYYNTADRIEATFEMRQYEYLNLLEQTAAPINFFLAMHMMTQDVEFMNELLEECNKENTYIELGLLEATESEFEHYNYGTDEKDAIRGGTISSYIVDTVHRWECCDDTTSTDSETGEETRTHHPHEGGPVVVGQEEGTYINNVEEVYETCLKYAGYTLKDFLNVKIKNTGDLYLIEADTWNLDYKLIPKVGDVERPFEKIQTVTRIQPTYVEYVERLNPYPPTLIGAHCGASDYSYLYEWKNTHFYIYENYAKWKNEYHVYSIINGAYKIDFIINLIKKYPQVENNLTTASYLLFALLEQNGNTQELERYMRYVLSEISGYQYLTDNNKELEFNFAVGLSVDELYNYNYDGSTSNYTVDVDSSAKSQSTTRKSGGSGRTAWHLEKVTTITTTDQDGEFINSRTYHYFKQGAGTNICGRTALATCLSGLGVVNPSTGQPYTPTEISPENTNNWFSWSTTLSGTGGRIIATKYTNNIRAKLIEHLSSGNPAILHIKSNSDPQNPYNTGSGHFIAVVGIKYTGDTLVYVLDPGSSKPTRTENYIDINTVLEYADELRTFKTGA